MGEFSGIKDVKSAAEARLRDNNQGSVVQEKLSHLSSQEVSWKSGKGALVLTTAAGLARSDAGKAGCCWVQDQRSCSNTLVREAKLLEHPLQWNLKIFLQAYNSTLIGQKLNCQYFFGEFEYRA